jgi:RHS repeat-associated protein
MKRYSWHKPPKAIRDTFAETPANSYAYGYDNLDRLTSGVRTGTTRGWSYDANGNRLTETGSAASTYTVTSTNNRISSISGALPRTYSYDTAGNVLTYATVTATYNNRGRMKTLKKGAVTATYVYNALGQFVKQSGGPSGTVHYVYDEAGHLLGEYNSTGALIQETIWMGDTPVATIRPGTPALVYYVHTDHLNTPRRVSRPSDNKLMWTWYSDPFGADLPNQNPAGGGTFKYNLRFPGQIYDSHAGLNQNYFRDYDPAVGRYVESDPIGLKGGVNTYGYVLQNPLMRSDPDGLLSQVVASCVCSFMKSNEYSSWQAWSSALALRKRPGPWNDPVLRPCENYLYAYAAVVDYGDPTWYVKVGVFGHDFLKRIGRSDTSPPSDEARDAGYEGATDGAARKDWKQQCEGCKH